MDNDIGSDLLSMAVCFDFCSTNVVQLSYRNPYFYQFRCHHPLIIQLSENIGACKSINSYSDNSSNLCSFSCRKSNQNKWQGNT